MSTGSAWLILFVAGLCEIGWAVGLKYTEGFSRLWPSAATLVAMAASVVLLGWSLKVLPLGTAYAVWTGIGAVGTAILGMFLFGATGQHRADRRRYRRAQAADAGFALSFTDDLFAAVNRENGSKLNGPPDGNRVTSGRASPGRGR